MPDVGPLRHRLPGVIGAASACFDCAVDYAKHRVQFAGKPIASHQLVQAKLAEMLTQITNMQLQAMEPLTPQDRREDSPRLTSA